MNDLMVEPYAQALFELALENQSLATYNELLHHVNQTLKELSSFQHILVHPNIEKKEKKNLIKEAFTNVDVTFLNFLYLLVDKRMYAYFFDITKGFAKKYREHYNTQIAYIYSATDLDDKTKAMLSNVLAKKLHKKMNMRFEIDEDLIAGIKIRVEDDVWEYNASKRLEDMLYYTKAGVIE